MTSSTPRRPREAWRKEAAETLRALAHGCESMADALDEDDDILGAMSGMIFANHLPALPKHIRDTFIEYLEDEAARALVAEQRYYAEMYPEPAA